MDHRDFLLAIDDTADQNFGVGPALFVYMDKMLHGIVFRTASSRTLNSAMNLPLYLLVLLASLAHENRRSSLDWTTKCPYVLATSSIARECDPTLTGEAFAGNSYGHFCSTQIVSAVASPGSCI